MLLATGSSTIVELVTETSVAVADLIRIGWDERPGDFDMATMPPLDTIALAMATWPFACAMAPFADTTTAVLFWPAEQSEHRASVGHGRRPARFRGRARSHGAA